ncbi:MAG TPA: hypothetical protein VEJ00_12195, partial [Candidatus Acidoferrales bacterium]|nr:hypothetical protein [Candidatus Acidoferrales bacterium]
SCCEAAGLWPDAVLSGHAHLYQRFTRTVNGRAVPYIVSGSGGFAATAPMVAAPPAGTVIGDHKLEVDPIIEFGYLTVNTNAKTLTVTFKTAMRGKPVTAVDFVTLDLVAGRITASGNPATAKKAGKAGRKAAKKKR